MSLELKDLKTKYEIAESVFQEIEALHKLQTQEEVFIDDAFLIQISPAEQLKRVHFRSKSGARIIISLSVQITEGQI